MFHYHLYWLRMTMGYMMIEKWRRCKQCVDYRSTMDNMFGDMVRYYNVRLHKHRKLGRLDSKLFAYLTSSKPMPTNIRPKAPTPISNAANETRKLENYK